jgi:hypothetical protein
MSDYLRELNRDGRPVIADFDFAATTVSGYLGEKFYHITTGKPGSFVIWDEDRLHEVSRFDALTLIDRIMTETGKRPLVLLNYPSQSRKLRLVHKTEGAIVPDENYFLYEYYR